MYQQHFVVKRFFFWLFVAVMYSNLYMQYLLTVNRSMFKWIFMQHLFILSDSLSENFVRYIGRFIHFNRMHYIFIWHKVKHVLTLTCVWISKMDLPALYNEMQLEIWINGLMEITLIILFIFLWHPLNLVAMATNRQKYMNIISFFLL